MVYDSYCACVYTKLAELLVDVFISLIKLRQLVEQGELTAHTHIISRLELKSGRVFISKSILLLVYPKSQTQL